MLIANKPEIEETEEELLKMKHAKVTVGLNDKQIAFCEYYARTNNVGMSAIKAGYAPKTANVASWKLRQNPKCAKYIAWLKIRIVNRCFLAADELLDQYVRMAFADISDFFDYNIKTKRVSMKPLDEIDGQIISEIQQKNGTITLKLVDKVKALEKLEQYLEVMPKGWKQQVEERKLKLLEDRLELDKKKAGEFEGDDYDDGFIEAIKSVAEEDWDDVIGIDVGE